LHARGVPPRRVEPERVHGEQVVRAAGPGYGRDRARLLLLAGRARRAPPPMKKAAPKGAAFFASGGVSDVGGRRSRSACGPPEPCLRALAPGLARGGGRAPRIVS